MLADLRALVASPHWRLMDGMLVTGDGWSAAARLVDVDGDGEPVLWTYGGYARGPAAASSTADTSPWDSVQWDPEVFPVVDDVATLGCLLAIAREAWLDLGLHTARHDLPDGQQWCVFTIDHGGEPVTHANTEAEALIAAILAAPPPEVSRD